MAFEKFEIATISTAIGIVAFLGLGVYLSTPSGALKNVEAVTSNTTESLNKISLRDLTDPTFILVSRDDLGDALRSKILGDIQCTEFANEVLAAARNIKDDSNIDEANKHRLVAFIKYSPVKIGTNYGVSPLVLSWWPLIADSWVPEKLSSIDSSEEFVMLGNDEFPIANENQLYEYIFTEPKKVVAGEKYKYSSLFSKHDGKVFMEGVYLVDGKLSSQQDQYSPVGDSVTDSISCLGEWPATFKTINASDP